MKRLKSLIFLVSLVLLLNTVASANNGGIVYTLEQRNLTYFQAGAEIQFDIYLLNRTPLSVPFYYASSTYWFWINKNVIPVGGTVTGTILSGNCELSNLTQKPTGVIYNTNSGDPANRYHFRVAGGNSTMDQSTASIISTISPGTQIARVSLVCKVSGVPTPFLVVNSEFEYKLPPIGGPNYTSVFAYLLPPPALTFTNMTYPPAKVGTPYTDNVHLAIDVPLPVELASFTGSVENKRDVTLSWRTVSEINNAGFDVERKLVSAAEWTKVGYTAGKNNAASYTFGDRKLNTGKYNYRLKQIDNNGNFKYYALANEVEVGVPTKFDLSQNYPNPFNPVTKIDYDLPFDSKVRMVIFDITGRELMTLVNEVQTAGYYTHQFNANSLSSGTYFYRLEATGGTNYLMTKKMVLIK